MIKLYWAPRTRSFTALWLMEETGQPYERVLIDISTGAQKTPEYLAINPMGKVPAIVHDGALVTEQGAVYTYLADLYPEAGITPAIGDPLRAVRAAAHSGTGRRGLPSRGRVACDLRDGTGHHDGNRFADRADSS